MTTVFSKRVFPRKMLLIYVSVGTFLRIHKSTTNNFNTYLVFRNSSSSYSYLFETNQETHALDFSIIYSTNCILIPFV